MTRSHTTRRGVAINDKLAMVQDRYLLHILLIMLITCFIATAMLHAQEPIQQKQVAASATQPKLVPEQVGDPAASFQTWTHGQSVLDASGDFLYAWLDREQQVLGVVISNNPPSQIESGQDQDVLTFKLGNGQINFSGNHGAMIASFGETGGLQQISKGLPANASNPVSAFKGAKQREPALKLRTWLKLNRWPTPTSPPIVGEVPPVFEPAQGQSQTAVQGPDADQPLPSMDSAIRRNNLNAIRQHLEAGADPNQIDNHGFPILFEAIRRRRTEVVKMLLDHKADPNIEHKKRHALHAALLYQGSTEMVEALIDAGADMEKLDPFQYTPLMFAVKSREPEIAELLIARGALVDATGRHGMTAIQHAIDRRRAEMVALLVRHGASLTVKDRQGKEVSLIETAKSRVEKNRESLAQAEAVLKALEQTAKPTSANSQADE